MTTQLVRSMAVFAGALALLPAAALPSCQTVYCHHESRLREREREAVARERLTRDSSDFSTWQQLMSSLSYKLHRERSIVRYAAHLDWEPQPELEIDLAARLRAERAGWITAWKQAFPERGEPWCAEAAMETSPRARVDLLRIATDLRPDDSAIHMCLVVALRAAGEPDEAAARIESFLDRHPDDAASLSERITMLRNSNAPPAQVRAALEERARRFPNERWIRDDLLRYYADNGLDAQRDELVAQIEANGSVSERAAVCSTLAPWGKSSEAQAQCRARLFADVQQAALTDDDRSSLLTTAVEAGEWVVINRLLAGWPKEDIANAWHRIALETGDDGCRALRAAWVEGALKRSLAGGGAVGQAGRLAYTLQQCGDVALAEDVERPFIAGATDEELASMTTEAAVAEARRRGLAQPLDPRDWWEIDDQAADKPLAERLPHLLAWHEARPDQYVPALRLSAAYEAAGRREEAVRWLLEAAARSADRREDLTLRAAALALRFRLHETAEASARKVLAAPASPRQHAEAHYLLGRVALREGRREEAVSELLRYFPLRLRYAGGCDIASPDRGLLRLLLANYDLPRLRVYLEERAAAVAWFEQHLHHPRTERPVTLAELMAGAERYDEPLTCLAQPLPGPVEPEVTLGCVPADADAYLAKGGAGSAPESERERRRREAAGRIACPAGWPTDLEPLFDDQRLLSFSEALTSYG